MAKLNLRFFVVTFLVSAFTLSLPSLSEAGARGARGAAVRAPIVNPPGGVGGPAAVEGPQGNVAVQGPRGNVVVGTRVNTLPVTATPVVVGANTYYVDGDVYYQEDDSGDEVVYVVVPAPQ